jgi:hypothetical protein
MDTERLRERFNEKLSIVQSLIDNPECIRHCTCTLKIHSDCDTAAKYDFTDISVAMLEFFTEWANAGFGLNQTEEKCTVFRLRLRTTRRGGYYKGFETALFIPKCDLREFVDRLLSEVALAYVQKCMIASQLSDAHTHIVTLPQTKRPSPGNDFNGTLPFIPLNGSQVQNRIGQ